MHEVGNEKGRVAWRRLADVDRYDLNDEKIVARYNNEKFYWEPSFIYEELFKEEGNIFYLFGTGGSETKYRIKWRIS